MRVFDCMNIRAAILTNAAGGINLEYKQGALVVLTDHINLQGENPLAGPNDERFGPRFPDMTQAYCKAYREIALAAAKKAGKTLHQGVYAGLLGPNYETPAEIRYLRTIGADLVGMSTVPEVIAARHMGIKVLAISCVTNMAAGILDQVINHEEVLQTGEQVKEDFVALIRAVLPQIAKDWRRRQSLRASPLYGRCQLLAASFWLLAPKNSVIPTGATRSERSGGTCLWAAWRLLSGTREHDRHWRLDGICRRKATLVNSQSGIAS